MIPGQGLGAEGRQVAGVHAFGGTPLPHLVLAVTPAQLGRLDGIGPGLIGAVRGFKPGIQPCTSPPSRLDHRRESAITSTDKVLHRRKAHIGEIRLQTTQLAQGFAQQLLTAHEFSRADAVPLERGVGLGREVADGQVEFQPSQVPALLLQRPAGLGDAQNVGIRFTGQADHEIELDLAVAALHGGTNAPQQLCIRQPLIHDVPQTLGAGLGREGQTSPPGAAQDVGDVAVEAINPLTRQGQGDVLVR